MEPKAPIPGLLGVSRLTAQSTAAETATETNRLAGAKAEVDGWSDAEINSNKAQRSTCTNAKISATRLINFALKQIRGKDPTTLTNSNTFNVLRDALKKFDEARTSIDVAIVNLMAQEHWNVQEYRAMLAALNEAYDQGASEVINFMDLIPPQYVGGQAGGHGAAPLQLVGQQAEAGVTRTAPAAVKANVALKPDHTLSLSDSPAKMESWFEDFRAYWSTSNFNLLTYRDQQSYLYSLIEPALRERVKGVSTEATPIFGPAPSVEATLRSEFDNRYPLFIRRRDFFYKRFTGTITEAPTFMAKLAVEANLARVQDMEVNDIIAYKALSSIQDVEFQRLCARETNLDLARLNVIVQQRIREVEYTSTKRTAKVLSMVDDKVKCHKCGRNGHLQKQCTAKFVLVQASLEKPLPAKKAGVVKKKDSSQSSGAKAKKTTKKSTYQREKKKSANHVGEEEPEAEESELTEEPLEEESEEVTYEYHDSDNEEVTADEDGINTILDACGKLKV